MYAGRIVEQGSVTDVIARPEHPYTRGIMGSTVTPGMRGQPLPAIEGAPPDLAHLPAGCAFAPRCQKARDVCRVQVPELALHGTHQEACWHPTTKAATLHQAAQFTAELALP